MRMKRFLYLAVVLFSYLPLLAQSLSEAEVTALMTNAFQLNQADNFQEALHGFLRVGENTKLQRTENERMVYVLSQTMAIMCYERLEQYQDGFILSEKLLKEKLTDKEKADVEHLYVMNGYFMATSFMRRDNSRYSEARALFDKILPYADKDMRKRILPKIPMSWYFEGMSYHLQQKYEEALSCAEKARDGFHDLGDIKSEIDVSCQIADIHSVTFDTLGALREYQKAGEMANVGKYDTKLMTILKEQRRLSKLIGNSDIVFLAVVQMDSLVALTNDEKLKYEYYNEKGSEAKGQGFFDLAEHFYLMNKQYVQQMKDEDEGIGQLLYYKNMQDLYYKAERYDKALKFAFLSKDRYHRKANKAEPNYYIPYMSIADIYSQMGDSAKCFEYLDTLFLALNKFNEPLQKHYLYITRAKCQFRLNKYEGALADYRNADKVLATCHNEGDSNRIMMLPLMGGIENKLKHYDESERLYREYAEKMKVLHGENSTDYIDAIYYLANAEGFAGHIAEGCRHYSLSIEKTKRQIREKLPFLTAKVRKEYWEKKSEAILNMTPFAIKAEELQTCFTKDCYDGLILTKAFLLESERSTFDIIKRSGTYDDRHNLAMITSMQAKIRDWERDYAHYADSILYLTSKADVLEKRLTDRCRSYGDMTEFMSIGYQEVKAKLNDGDILIDFTDFVSQTRGRVYAAYIIDNKQEFPLLKELFEENVIDSMQIRFPNDYYSESNAKKMLQLLWSPLKDYITEGAKVYYVPTQLLFQIALESLPTEDGSLLGENYQFIRLSSAREIVNEKAKLEFDMTQQRTNAVLYGGLNYSLSSKVMEDEAAKYDIASLLATRGDILRGDSIFDDLPETKSEIDEIQNILKSDNLSVVPYSGINGTEESFMNMHGKAPQLLHIATHGFYYTPDLAQKYEYLKGYTDAMSLSGLVMSGGNAAWSGKELPEGVLGGILTAANISRLDLNGIQLAVLSACKTGRGEATPEGLFGLQRAFKKAGVQTLIMSLWSISDIYTKEFMVKFYTNLAHNGWDKRKAFQDAKKSMRDDYKDPYYWAGFVMLD